MPRVILLLIILCQATPSQAIIPLELVAEFDLPENVSLWDVQHWMDEESFGYAYIRNDTVYYVPRIGDSLQHFVIPQSLFDSTGWSGPTYQAMHIHRLAERPDAPILSLSAEVSDWEWSDHLFYGFLLIYDLAAQELLYYNYDYSGHYSDSDGWNWHGESLWIESWPPPPAFSTRVYLQNRRVSDFEGPGTDRVETTFGTTIFRISEDTVAVRGVAGMFDIFPNSDGDLALLDVLIGYTEYGEDYGRVTAGLYADSIDSLRSTRICNFPCIRQRPIAMESAFGGRSFVSDNQVVDLTTLSVVDTMTGFWATTSIRLAPRAAELLWCKDFSSYHGIEPETLDEDSTQALDGDERTVLTHFDGTGEIVLYEMENGYHTGNIFIYRPTSAPQNLTVTLAEDMSHFQLSWNHTLATNWYLVCRKRLPGSTVCDDLISVLGTTAIFSFEPGLVYETFQVFSYYP